jgi:hypothetical protein
MNDYIIFSSINPHKKMHLALLCKLQSIKNGFKSLLGESFLYNEVKNHKIVIVFLLSLFFSGYAQSATTTTINNIYRFVSASDYEHAIGTVINTSNPIAFLNDWALGIKITVNEAGIDDKWYIEYIDSNGDVFYSTTMTYRYVDGDGYCFVVFAIPTPIIECGSNSDWWLSGKQTHCKMKGMYNIRVTYTPSSGTPQQIFNNYIDVQTAGIGFDIHRSDQQAPNYSWNISPKIAGRGGIKNRDPGKMDITLKTTDSGCINYPLPNMVVNIESKVVPKSGGHDHLGEHVGTGSFDPSKPLITSKQVTTDRRDATATFTYTAGVVGLEEKIIAKAELDNKEFSAERAIKIDVAAPPANIPLVQLAPGKEVIGGNQHYERRQNNLNPPHKTGDNSWGKSSVIKLIQDIADALYERRSLRNDDPIKILSVNDISLPYGGVFDNCESLDECTTNEGHMSHKVGADFDINKELSGVENSSSSGDRDFVLNYIRHANPKCFKLNETSFHIRCTE